MLRQSSIDRLRKSLLSRADGRVVVTMRHYPRGLRKDLIDEYSSALAPSPELFADFKRLERAGGHDAAFVGSRYEERFTLGEKALGRLEELAALARREEVHLVCQCEMGRRCHRELLLLLAKARFGARIDKVYNQYPRFAARVAGGEFR